MKLDIFTRIHTAMTFEDMEFEIAKILENNNSKKNKVLVIMYATSKVINEGWRDSYRIENVNGYGRPLTREELNMVGSEDSRNEIIRNRGVPKHSDRTYHGIQIK